MMTRSTGSTGRVRLGVQGTTTRSPGRRPGVRSAGRESENRQCVSGRRPDGATISVPRTNGATVSSGTTTGSQPKAQRSVFRSDGRVRVDGKFFALDGERFPFRGVTYGTFAPRTDGTLFPDRERIQRDLVGMREHGFTVVRTYTAPSNDLLEAAGEHGCDCFPTSFIPTGAICWAARAGSAARSRSRRHGKCASGAPPRRMRERAGAVAR